MKQSSNKAAVRVDKAEMASKTAPPASKQAVKVQIPILERSDQWLKQRIIPVICILILAWAGIRIAYYQAVVKSPLYSYYLFDQSDNKFFDDWAKELNKDWLNAKPLHPYHMWHKSFADYYLERHPDKLAELQAINKTKDSLFDAGKALWNVWYNGNQYHQEPLYPYMLAVLYHFHLNEVNGMMILQLLLGVFSGVLIFLISRKYFGETTAVLAGILYFFCGILMYNEVLLLRTTWSVFLTLLMVYVTDRVFSEQKPLDFFISGLCIGFAFLMQSTFSMFLLGTFVISFFVKRQSTVQYLKHAALMLAGYFIMFSPVIIRNKIVGAPTFSISSVGPVTFVSTNAYGKESGSGWNPLAERDVELFSANYNSLSNAVIATIKGYPSLGVYFVFEWKKLKAVWKGVEYANNTNYYFYKRYLPVLNITFVNFFLIAPLALAGLIFCLYHRKKYYALYLAIGIQLFTLLIFYVLARLRAPLVILSLPLAAFAIVDCIDFINRKKKLAFAKIGVVGMLVFLSFSGYSKTEEDSMVDDGNYKIVYHTYFKDKLDGLTAKKEWDKWLALQAVLLDMEPDLTNGAPESAEGGSIRLGHVFIAEFFIKMHDQRKNIYAILGDKANVQKEENIIKLLNQFTINSVSGVNIAGDSKNIGFMYNLGKSYVTLEQYPKAIDMFKKVIAITPTYENAHFDLGNAYFHMQQYDSSEKHELIAIQQNPANAKAYNDLGGICYFRNKYPEAIAMCRNAINLMPNYPDPYINIGVSYLSMNNIDSGIYYLNRAINIDPSNGRAYDYLTKVYSTLGKTDSVKKYQALIQMK